MIEEDHFHAATRELVQQQDLVGVLAREPIRDCERTADPSRRWPPCHAIAPGPVESTWLRCTLRRGIASPVPTSDRRWRPVPPDAATWLAMVAASACCSRRHAGIDRRNAGLGLLHHEALLACRGCLSTRRCWGCSWGRRADRRTSGSNRSYADAKTSSDSRERSNPCSTLAIRLFGVAVRSIVATSLTARSYTIGRLAT